jgi:hypothetical protein
MAFGATQRAGSYAQARYRRGLRNWRSRSRPLLALFFGPFLLGGVAGLVVVGDVAAWLAGVAFGLGLGVWMVMRESPPAYIENWQVGAEGERKTERALARLDRSRWLVVHDVQCARGNYDHIVVSRAGVFLLETKNLRGTVEIRDGVLRLQRRLDPQEDKPCPWVRSSALARAASLNAEIQQLAGHRPWVQAVVVLWSDFNEGVYEDERCVVVHGSRLHEWLNDRPDMLDEKAASDIRAAIHVIANRQTILE